MSQWDSDKYPPNWRAFEQYINEAKRAGQLPRDMEDTFLNALMDMSPHGSGRGATIPDMIDDIVAGSVGRESSTLYTNPKTNRMIQSLSDVNLGGIIDKAQRADLSFPFDSVKRMVENAGQELIDKVPPKYIKDVQSRVNVGPAGPWDFFPGGEEGFMRYISQGLGIPNPLAPRPEGEIL